MTKRDDLYARILAKAQFRRESQPGMQIVPLDVADVEELLYWLRPRQRKSISPEEARDRN